FMALIFDLQKITGGQKANDTELLLSMPFKRIEIIIAKTLSSFVFNLAFVILFFLPSVIAYLVYTPFNLAAIL
ncbi:MAG: ABC-2 transporter permease, partial [Clostridia bacterium]|nr:ABC-2 transporter permease [Clostridia bacterium]